MRRVGMSLLTAAMAGLPGCGTVGFYSQALKGQWEIQRKARPIDHVLADSAVAAETRADLARVPAIRRFASTSLGLPDNPSYTTFADLGRDHVVWVVFATEEFSTTPKSWWYPIVGSLAYRGYFSEHSARALASRLEAEDLETYVGSVDAYSTLGLLGDPVLNTFVHQRDTQLAELIFHELTHQRLYLAGDTEFNEALATAYAQHGVNRWLAETGASLTERNRYTAAARGLRAFVTLALETRDALAASYAGSTGKPPAVRRAAKQAILEDFERRASRLSRSHPTLTRVHTFFEEPVTNARLATLATYYDLVPGFEALLARHPNDPEAFFQEVEAFKAKPKTERHADLRALAVSSDAPDGRPNFPE